MKLMLLGAGSAIHTQRWANGLAAAGVEVVCVSQHPFIREGWDARVECVRLPRQGRAGYFLNARAVARLFVARRCDLLNAHYATGYGVLAMRSGVRPRMVSVWGSDVYDFPAASPLHRALLRRVLTSADAVASTSHAMAHQVLRVLAGRSLQRPIEITPFGVETARFTPAGSGRDRGQPLVVGTVKVLAPKYGIDTLIRAFALLPGGRAQEPAGRPVPVPMRLRIVGDGPQRAELQALAVSLGLGDRVQFAGAAAHAQVPAHLQGFDVFVAASRLDSESFGVAVIEASACALPVVVTRVGGLPEVVRDGETGLIVERDDPGALAAAIQRLVDDPALRERLGRAGREWVQQEYEWHGCVQRMVGVYRQFLPRATKGPLTAPGGGAMTSAAAEMDRQEPQRPAGGQVSVIVPCRNERRYIEAFAASVFAQSMPAGWGLQLVIADGMSDDGTREILQRLASADARLQCIDNPLRIVSTGLNRALAHARGEVIVRMDVHTEYAPDYIAQCLAALAETGADNVGGPWQAQPDAGAGPMQQAVAAAFQSRWVAGGARSRQLNHDGWVDTVYLGCWPRATFERFGGFDESLVRNQDDEHNLRIARGGGRVWQSSRIRSVYRPRAALSQVFRQYLQYGYWKPFVMKKHGQAASVRQLIPALLVTAFVVLLVAALLGAARWPLWTLLGLYGGAVIGMTAGVAASGTWGVAALARVPAVVATYHLSYGIGSLFGWWDALRHGRGRERFAALTR